MAASANWKPLLTNDCPIQPLAPFILQNQKLTRLAALATSAVVLSPAAALAARYDALCGGTRCTIGVTASGISAQGVTIPAHRVTSWSIGGDSETDVTTGVVTTVLFGGLGLLGFAAKKHDYNVSISGYDAQGKKANISFRFINDKPAKRIASQLPSVTGLGVNQQRTMEEILAYEKGERSENTLGAVASLPSRLGGVGGPSLPSSLSQRPRTIAQAQPKNCWSTYLKGNPAMAKWAEANPTMAAQNKKRFDDC